MKQVFIILLVVFSVNKELFAQGERNFQIWTDFDPSYKLNEKWKVGGDLGYRIEPSTGNQTAYIRPGITYKIANILRFSIGAANFNTWAPESFIVTELRTFQFINMSWPRLGNFQFKHRLGLEQRWFYVPDFGLNEFIHRARYYIEVISPKFNLFGLGSPFFLTANFEMLRDVNNTELKRLVDHNRVTIGMGNHITEKFKVEIRYKIISFVDPVLNEFLRETDVIRIRLYYQFASS